MLRSLLIFGLVAAAPAFADPSKPATTTTAALEHIVTRIQEFRLLKNESVLLSAQPTLSKAERAYILKTLADRQTRPSQ